MIQVNEFNAYAYNDNFRIVVQSTDQTICTEHNQTEAEAIAKWLTYEKGTNHTAIRNSREEVRAARAIRKDVIRHPLRDEALEQMGVI
jgi:hypothetical protein